MGERDVGFCLVGFVWFCVVWVWFWRLLHAAHEVRPRNLLRWPRAAGPWWPSRTYVKAVVALADVRQGPYIRRLRPPAHGRIANITSGILPLRNLFRNFVRNKLKVVPLPNKFKIVRRGLISVPSKLRLFGTTEVRWAPFVPFVDY